MKLFVLNTFLYFLFTLFSAGPAFAYTILIDPGHGGDDDGAKAAFDLSKNRDDKTKMEPDVFEKELALTISKKLMNLLKDEYTVFLTRTIDRTITLDERAEMANKIQADLFISVHLNSSLDSSSHGHEIYYLDNHNDVGAKRVEQLENINTKGEQMIVQKILIDLVVERTASISKRLADDVQDALKLVMKRFGITNRGAKPGLFYVLALSKRPAILLEVGFMSNGEELKKMISEEFQNSYVKAVASGVKQFIKKENKDKSGISVL